MDVSVLCDMLGIFTLLCGSALVLVGQLIIMLAQLHRTIIRLFTLEWLDDSLRIDTS
jgi:hypothetical protein